MLKLVYVDTVSLQSGFSPFFFLCRFIPAPLQRTAEEAGVNYLNGAKARILA